MQRLVLLLRAATLDSIFSRRKLPTIFLATLTGGVLIVAQLKAQESPAQPPGADRFQVRVTLQRLPVPNAAQLQAAQAKIRELLANDLERAAKNTDKIILANKLLKLAGETTDDATARFALLTMGRDLALEGEDLTLGWGAHELLIQDYDLVALDESYKLLTKWLENPEAKPEGLSEAAQQGLKIAEQCAGGEDFGNALKFARLALETAKKSRTASLIKQITAFGTDIATRQKEFAEVQAAVQKLAADPTDPAANMALGRWHWFRKGELLIAMPYLAKTSESPLKQAAIAELENPSEPAARLALADQWWALAQVIQDEAIKKAILGRAAEWYELTLPKITGLDKAKAERRIAEVKNHLAKGKTAPPADGPPGRADAKPAALTPDERLKLALAAGGTNESEAAVERGLKWLAAMQARDGGWIFDTRVVNAQTTDAGSANLARNGATGLALMPFLAAGYTHQTPGPYQATLKKGLEFLTKNVNRKYSNASSVAWHEEQGTMYSHGIAAAAMCDAYAKTKDKALLPYAQGGINFIALAQDPKGGGWRYVPQQAGDTSVTGWQFMALQSGALGNLKINPATINLGLKFLDSVSDPQDAHAYYGYTGPGRGPAQTAIGLLCRVQMGWKKETAGLKTGVEFLTKAGPNKSNNYLNYYTNNLLFQWGGEEWKTWNTALRDQLLTMQSVQGVDAGSWHPGSRDQPSVQGGRLYNTALSCLMLEVYYRYPRVLKE
jgi:hypothetical protein